MKFSVLGADGFIGSHLVAALRDTGADVRAVGRLGESTVANDDLGHVIDCAGITGDFRTRPFEAVDAHTCRVAHILRHYQLESYLMLSSTRVYLGASRGDEDAQLVVDARDPGRIYGLSKLTGEALCLTDPRPTVRVVRLSNVFGSDFDSDGLVPSAVRESVDTGRFTLRTHPSSAKDYVAVDDVVGVLPRIAATGQDRLYNVGSGYNVSAGTVAQVIADAAGAVLDVDDAGRVVRFPEISIHRIANEFGFRASRIEDRLAGIVEDYRRRRKQHDQDRHR